MTKTSFLGKLFWAGVHVVTLGLMAATLVGFLGHLWWIFDLLAHFRVQYLAAALLLLGVYALGKRWGWGLLVAGTALLNLSLILPLFVPVHVSEAQPPSYRLFLSNVLTSNSQHERTRRLIEESNADFVALLEVNQNWLDDLQLEALGYAYSVTRPQEDNFGIALYSRYPIEQWQLVSYDPWGLPVIVAEIRLDEGLVTLVVVHTVPPKSSRLTEVRNEQMAGVAAFVGGLEPPVIVAGDLNATSWSPYFSELLNAGHLRDSRRGFGVQPTWNGMHPFLPIPIDHILVSPNIQVNNRYIGAGIGSDHRPVIMDFSVLP